MVAVLALTRAVFLLLVLPTLFLAPAVPGSLRWVADAVVLTVLDRGGRDGVLTATAAAALLPRPHAVLLVLVEWVHDSKQFGW